MKRHLIWCYTSFQTLPQDSSTNDSKRVPYKMQSHGISHCQQSINAAALQRYLTDICYLHWTNSLLSFASIFCGHFHSWHSKISDDSSPILQLWTTTTTITIIRKGWLDKMQRSLIESNVCKNIYVCVCVLKEFAYTHKRTRMMMMTMMRITKTRWWSSSMTMRSKQYRTRMFLAAKSFWSQWKGWVQNHHFWKINRVESIWR